MGKRLNSTAKVILLNVKNIVDCSFFGLTNLIEIGEYHDSSHPE